MPSWKNLMRVGILTLFALLAIGGTSSYLESASGDDLVADLSSIFDRAASGIFNGTGTSERFIGAANVVEKPFDSAASPVFYAKPADTTHVLASNAQEKININTANSNELQKITGIGPVTAQKIIDYRNMGGIFYKIEDIQGVSGIGPATFEKMKLEITVGNVVPPTKPDLAPTETSVAPPLDESAGDGSKPFEKININTASASELDEITGVGPAIAKRIIDHRRSHGLFYKIEDIKNVSGIGDATFNKMRDEITVGNVTLPAESESEPDEEPENESESAAEELQPESEPQQEPVEATQTEELARFTGVVVSEIMAGADGNSDYEFIELYNPTDSPIDLTGWSVKKKSSTGVESSLVVSSRFAGKTIPAEKYLLVAKEEGYNGEVAPDVGWPKSYTLAYTNNSIVLYGPSGQIEEVFWANIPPGSSFERDSWLSPDFHAQSGPSPTNSSEN